MQTYRDVKLSDNAVTVLEKRYLLKDSSGQIIETPKEMFIRIAHHVAEADRQYGATDESIARTQGVFYEMMAALYFLPNSPTLMNAGCALGQLSACFVLPVGDSMIEIFEAIKHAAMIHQSGGGTGFSFSQLRPRNSVVASTSGVASGPVSFMRVFNASTEAVKQGGARRGANMGVLRVDHPDIIEFINCKADPDEFNNFNISVGVTDAFMTALQAGDEYALINPHTGRVHQVDGRQVRLDAREVYQKIVEQAWFSGEPGVVFIDRMNEQNPTFPDETIEATNPCGEQPLPAYDSCNLGSINLSRFVLRPLPPDYDLSRPSDGVDWDHLRKVIHSAVHFLDNVVDCNSYPLAEIDQQSKKNRRIGLGVMGWADMLVQLGLSYNGKGAVALGEEIMAYVQIEARKHSSELAKVRGKFPNWANSVFGREKVAMRNATVTTVAPTGTLSIIAGCSPGIEPYYGIAYERRVLDGSRLVDVNPLFEKAVRQADLDMDAISKELASVRSIADLDMVPDGLKDLFLTAEDISPDEHVRMQAAFQKHCDSSVSKTINLPESATSENVARAFQFAYEMGCKGITVYRDNSRQHQVLSVQGPKGINVGVAKQVVTSRRPTLLNGFTEKVRTGYGNLYVTVNVKDGRPFEVFAQIGKSGYTTMADTEAICRLISLSLRSDIPVDLIICQLRGIGGSSQVFSGSGKVASIPDAIAQVLQRHFGLDADKGVKRASPAEICPECSGGMTFDGGCFSCPTCGYSSC